MSSPERCPVEVLRAERPRGGVVVVSEVWGVEPPLRTYAERLVAHGYDVALPDIWWRRGGPPPFDGPDGVHAAVAQLGDFEVLADVGAARDALRPELPRFVIGFCIGGLAARNAACTVPGFSGAVEFYGRIRYGALTPKKPAQPLDLVPGLACPLLCHFGDADPVAPIEDVRELARRLQATSVTALVHVYPGCGHAFMNPSRPGWNADAAATAWGRTLAFLDHLAAAAG
jgi:carboxymethylenebutenolidase